MPCDRDELGGLCVICDRGQLNEEHQRHVCRELGRRALLRHECSACDELQCLTCADDRRDCDGSDDSEDFVDAMIDENAPINQQFTAGDVAGAAARWEVLLTEAQRQGIERSYISDIADGLNRAIHIGELGMPYVYLSDGSSDSDSE